MTSRAAVGAADTEAAARVRLGPIAVRTGATTVQDFQRACGGSVSPGKVPLVFPISWLAHPEVRTRLLEMAGARDLVPIQESQSFTTTRCLELDRDYLLAAEIERTSEPERMTLHGTVTQPGGDICVRFATVLRLIGPSGSDGAVES
jgi:hypothetical protein